MRYPTWPTSLILALVLASPALPAAEDPPKLLGRCTRSQLAQEPFAEWSRSGYEQYTPNEAILSALRASDTEGLRFTLFFGSWCGDSRREVPRLIRLFDAMGVPEDRLELVAVDRTDQALKRSPGGEERGLEIYRVPTLVVERDGREIGRIVEHPARSLERDLQAILSGAAYMPSYAAYPIVRRWLSEGLLADPNVSPWGLAEQLRSTINGEGDLAAAARVLQSRGELSEAIKLFEVNCALYRESAGCHQRLAEALLEQGDRDGARRAVDRALRYNEDPERLQELTELVRKIEVGS